MILDSLFITLVFTFKILKLPWLGNHSSANGFRICNILKNHLRSLFKMQIPRFAPQVGSLESLCLANIPGDFRASGGANTLGETILGL